MLKSLSAYYSVTPTMLRMASVTVDCIYAMHVIIMMIIIIIWRQNAVT